MNRYVSPPKNALSSLSTPLTAGEKIVFTFVYKASTTVISANPALFEYGKTWNNFIDARGLNSK